ncbi:hypothetical protein BGZ54_009271, partial [Gamsiella multidivaricata]
MLRARPTLRQRLISACLQEFFLACGVALVRMEHSLPVNIHQVEAYALLVTHLYQHRHLLPRGRRLTSADLRRVLDEYNDNDFKAIIRLTPIEFQDMAELFAGHYGLVERDYDDEDGLSNIKLRLNITLFRLGTKGISIKKVAWIFGVSEGSVHGYTWWCIEAIDAMAENFVVWLDHQRRAEISRWFRKEKGFPNCIGAVDGVPFPFDMAPKYETKTWNTRKY